MENHTPSQWHIDRLQGRLLAHLSTLSEPPHTHFGGLM